MSAESENETPQPTRAEEKGEGRSNNKRASAAALIDAFAQQYQADRQEAGRREGHRIFREWLTIIGLFLAAAVAFFQWRELRSTDHNIAEQARTAAGQLAAMEGQLKEMRATGAQTDILIAENKKSADAAAQSAKATEASVKLATDTAKRQLRAYLTVSDFKIECINCDKRKKGWWTPKNVSPEPRVLLKIKNSGVTPAYMVRACSRTKMVEHDKELPSDFSFDCSEICKTCPPSNIGPGGENIMSLPIDFRDILMATASFELMYFYGQISFKDTFGAERSLPFCWRIIGQEDTAYGCERHNSPNDE